MELILSSDFPLEGNDGLFEYIRNRTDSKLLSIAFVAALEQSIQFEEYKNIFIENGFTKIEYFEITKEISPVAFEFLNAFNILYLHGGDPFKILSRYQQSGFDRYLRGLKNSDKIIIGASGSTMVLSSELSILCSLYPKLKNKNTRKLKGLNLFPFAVLPHFDRYEKTIDKIQDRPSSEKIYAIHNGSAVIYNEENIVLMGNVTMH